MPYVFADVAVVSRFAAVEALVRAGFERIVDEAGEDLAAATRQNMYPGHAYETGHMQRNTAYDRQTRQVVVATEYAVYVEFGTAHMAPRAFLRPAIAAGWPRFLFNRAGEIRATLGTSTFAGAGP